MVKQYNLQIEKTGLKDFMWFFDSVMMRRVEIPESNENVSV